MLNLITHQLGSPTNPKTVWHEIVLGWDVDDVMRTITQIQQNRTVGRFLRGDIEWLITNILRLGYLCHIDTTLSEEVREIATAEEVFGCPWKIGIFGSENMVDIDEECPYAFFSFTDRETTIAGGEPSLMLQPHPRRGIHLREAWVAVRTGSAPKFYGDNAHAVTERWKDSDIVHLDLEKVNIPPNAFGSDQLGLYINNPILKPYLMELIGKPQ